MQYCPHPESVHLFCWWKKTKERDNSWGTVHSTGAETQELPVCCRATQRLQGAQTLHRPDRNYNFNKTFLPRKTKHLRKMPEAIQMAPFSFFLMFTSTFSHIKKQPFTFTYLLCTSDYNFHITAVINERLHFKQKRLPQ